MRGDVTKKAAGLTVIAIVFGVLGVFGPAQAEDGTFRLLIRGAFGAPTGTSADTQVSLRIGVGLPVFNVNAAGAPVGGSLATATFAQWSDTVPTSNFFSQSFLMIFRQPSGFMAVAAGATTPNGLASTFSATAHYQNLNGGFDIVAGTNPADALVTFNYDTNPHIKHNESVRLVAGNALGSVATKAIPGVANVDSLRSVPIFVVANNAKDIQIGTLKGHNASGIVGQVSEFVELRAIYLNLANLYVLYGCAAPTATSGVVCLIGGNGFATHLSGPVAQIAGNLRKATISGVVDADLVIEVAASLP